MVQASADVGSDELHERVRTRLRSVSIAANLVDGLVVFPSGGFILPPPGDVTDHARVLIVNAVAFIGRRAATSVLVLQ